MSLARASAEFNSPTGQIVRYSFAGVRPSPRAVVAVTNACRASALSAFHVLTGARDSFVLSGHCGDGSPDREHRHAYFLPEIGADGTIVGMLVVNPSSRFSREETEALRMVRVIRWNGPSTMIHAEFSDGDDSAARQLATRWVSATPYVPLRRYWGTHGKHHLTPEKQLALELHGIGVGKSVAEADVTQQGIVGVRVGTMTRKRHGPGEAPRRRGFRVEFRTHDPICGPVALGHSCHYGLGLFVPAER